MSDVVILITVLGASAISVGLIIALNAWLGGWTPRRFATLKDAARAIEDQVFGFDPSEDGVLARGGRAALIVERGGGRLGLATTAGDRAIVRALRPGELQGVSLEGSTLTLTLGDYTFPKAWLTFEDAATASIWAERAEGFAVRPEGAGAKRASHA
ncbi:MAG: hypothetical protein ABL308_01230 [Oceanicaulis sp.]